MDNIFKLLKKTELSEMNQSISEETATFEYQPAIQSIEKKTTIIETLTLKTILA